MRVFLPTYHHPAEPLPGGDILSGGWFLAAILSDLRVGTASRLGMRADPIGTDCPATAEGGSGKAAPGLDVAGESCTVIVGLFEDSCACISSA